jgi:NADH:ubiquinone oxidoreductase subunit 5 (subunit L)/multisubunit Na+/H+ antiporter MnhA subunit
MAGATIGVFMSLDLFFLYFFYEMSVIPMYLLLGMWGSHTKGYLEMTAAWFEAWEEHANHDNDFGGEHSVMKHLRRAIRFAREEA